MTNKMRIRNHPRNYNGNLVARFAAGHDDVWAEFSDDEKPRKKRRPRRPKIGVYRRKPDESKELEKEDLKALESKGWKVNLASEEEAPETPEDTE